MHWIALQPRPGEPACLQAWTLQALRLTPWVARLDTCLVLEVAASERLFGGRAALLGLFLMPNEALAPVDIAQGATSLIAAGRLDLVRRIAQEPHAERRLPLAQQLEPDQLPLHTLVAARPHLPILVRLGVRRWGQLRALPRDGLARRFGAELLTALDRAYGQHPDTYAWLQVPDVFASRLELPAHVGQAPALLFAARRLLAQLRLWLQARQHGVLELELVWSLDARRTNAQHVDAHHDGRGTGRLVVGTAQATQDMAHLERLLGEHLARVQLPAPVVELRLRSLRTQPQPGHTRSLLPQDQRRGDSLHHLVERLQSRLGPQAVRGVRLQADHRPECMQCWQTLDGTALPASAGSMPEQGPHAALHPTWLLAQPLALQQGHSGPLYQGPLTLLVGPQRLEVGWLQGQSALRDYYLARSPQAGLVWVFHQRLAQTQASAWYLHGLFA